MNTKQYAKKKGISERTARWRAQKKKGVSASKPGGHDWNMGGGGPKKQRGGGRKKKGKK